MDYLSIIALVIAIFTFVSERISMRDKAYSKFSDIWLDMDQVFIDHPSLHKYFYTQETLDNKSTEYDLALCIAERFLDVFQYTKPLEKYLNKNDRQSYHEYRTKIENSPIMKEAKDKLIWSDKWNGNIQIPTK